MWTYLHKVLNTKKKKIKLVNVELFNREPDVVLAHHLSILFSSTLNHGIVSIVLLSKITIL